MGMWSLLLIWTYFHRHTLSVFLFFFTQLNPCWKHIDIWWFKVHLIWSRCENKYEPIFPRGESESAKPVTQIQRAKETDTKMSLNQKFSHFSHFSGLQLNIWLFSFNKMLTLILKDLQDFCYFITSHSVQWTATNVFFLILSIWNK